MLSLSGFVPLELVGFGRFDSTPALFLSDDATAGRVLPVPVPLDAVMAIEQALSPKHAAMLEVLLHARPIAERDDGVFDNLPWDWSEDPQAKRFAYDRFTGRSYPREGYESPYGLLLDVVRRDCCAEVAHVLIENADALGVHHTAQREREPKCLVGQALAQLLRRRVGAAGRPEGVLRRWGGRADRPRR